LREKWFLLNEARPFNLAAVALERWISRFGRIGELSRGKVVIGSPVLFEGDISFSCLLPTKARLEDGLVGRHHTIMQSCNHGGHV